ncbi:MAG: NAD(+)/NADH kinase [Lachnospiraceae bacterium]|nr:NAD(+)/NADH kinase [Lachnospiraceae bacterium]
MKKFGIVTNEMKDPGFRVTDRIKAYLEKRGADCEVAPGAAEISAGAECILVLGGDGTMLQAAKETAGRNIPLLGINLGSLGYLAEVEVASLEDALDKLLAGNYETEEAMMVYGIIRYQDHSVETSPALNDISITRCGTLQIIKLNIFVNGKFLCQWKADGIILSTPTGSTGYNMSAGGPLVVPGADLLLLTPICAHTLSARSIVLRGDDEVEVEVAHGRADTSLTVEANSDGSEKFMMKTGDRIRISKAKETTTVIKLNRVGFLEMLHKKMSDEK